MHKQHKLLISIVVKWSMDTARKIIPDAINSSLDTLLIFQIQGVQVSVLNLELINKLVPNLFGGHWGNFIARVRKLRSCELTIFLIVFLLVFAILVYDIIHLRKSLFISHFFLFFFLFQFFPNKLHSVSNFEQHVL